jgi:hypothetical protein
MSELCTGVFTPHEFCSEMKLDVVDRGKSTWTSLKRWSPGDNYLRSPSAHPLLRKAVGLSVAEVNPDHDPGLVMTSRLIDELVASPENRLMSSDEKLGSR